MRPSMQQSTENQGMLNPIFERLFRARRVRFTLAVVSQEALKID
jgi:hypothetical protein